MNTLFIDGREYATARALPEGLQRLLALPAHYGMNADALHDCLAERAETVNMIVHNPGNADVTAALRKCACVLEDLDGDVKGLA